MHVFFKTAASDEQASGMDLAAGMATTSGGSRSGIAGPPPPPPPPPPSAAAHLEG